MVWHDRSEDIDAIKEHIRKRDERWATMTPEAVKQECRDYLVKLGTHRINAKGEYVISPQYGGEPIDTPPECA